MHDESATGETIFLEPTGAIELGNQLRGAVVEAEREELRVLRDLTGALRPHADTIAAAHEMCVGLDDLNARARYALAAGGTIPELHAQGEGLVLREARHPLLIARGVAAIPFDLSLTAEQTTLLISGPNAGGKTVLLKTVGLAAALTQSGVAPPIGAGSALPVYSAIVADIGDHQSIAADLSTFSAHLAVLREVLRRADRGTLVLMDEIGSGTDPAEGSALAAAALRTLTRRGARTIATTHLGTLKALATRTPGIVNGSLQFDPDRLVPTFRFSIGVPGRSYGIAMARRLGVSPEVVAEAEGEVPEAERSLDLLLEEAERRGRALAASQADLEGRLAEVDGESRRLTAERAVVEARDAELRARERSAEQRARAEARRLLMAARSEVDDAVRAAQGAATREQASEARRALEAAIRREGEALRDPDQPPVSAAGARQVAAGQRVRLGSGSIGRVIQLREDGKVMVVAGSVKVVVPAGELTAIPEEPESPTPTYRREPAYERLAAAHRLTEIDLRGMRADEAEAATLSAVDAAILGDVPYLRIIHGLGTGAAAGRGAAGAHRRPASGPIFAPPRATRAGSASPSRSSPDEPDPRRSDRAGARQCRSDRVDRRNGAAQAHRDRLAGACPFHGGQHRNFAVIPRKGMYYCYVCHEAGDVFTFLMKRQGLDYPSAVREIARRAGISIPERTGPAEGPDPREPLFTAVAAAQEWFATQLREHAEAAAARTYLEGRDLPLEIAGEHGLGYAPRAEGFRDAMRTLGIAEATLLDAGLLHRREDGSVGPRFRQRLLFPIRDLRGRVVGFGGRSLDGREPKYLNSPESPIFHKGAMLYNLHEAKQAIRREGSALLVEGYFDVLRLVLAGIDPVVAPMGTALTPDQAALLKRFAPQVTLLYDSDAAGLRATFRTADECLRHKLRVRVATLPEGQDPDSLVRSGGAPALEAILRDAIDPLERKIQLLERKGWFEGLEHRRDALDRLLPTARAAGDPIARDLYLARIAERTGVSRPVLEQELASAREPVTPRLLTRDPRPAPSARPARITAGSAHEAQLVAVMLGAPLWRERGRSELTPDLFQVPAHREIFQWLAALSAGALITREAEGLSPRAQEVYQRLLERAAQEETAGLDRDELFSSALETLRARTVAQSLPPITEIENRQSALGQLSAQERHRLQLQKAARRSPSDPSANS